MFLRVLLLTALVLSISIDVGHGADEGAIGELPLLHEDSLNESDGGVTLEEDNAKNNDSAVTNDGDTSLDNQIITILGDSGNKEDAGSHQDLDDDKANADDASQEGVIGEPPLDDDDSLKESGGVTLEEDGNSNNNDSAVTDERDSSLDDAGLITSLEDSSNKGEDDADSNDDLDDEAAADDASQEGVIGEPPLDDDSLKESGGVTLEDDGDASNNDSAVTDDGDTSLDDGGITTLLEDSGKNAVEEASSNDDGGDAADDMKNNSEGGMSDQGGIVDDKTVNDNNGNNDGVVARRKKRAAVGQEILLSKDHHPLEVTLVLLDDSHRRVKRTSFNKSSLTWPHRIPYIFTSSYKKANIHQLKKVLSFLDNNLCVEFKHEPDFDVSNKNWLKEHGYTTNAYLRFSTKASCYALYGRGPKDEGGRNISPCNQFFSMTHEAIHALGGIHSQNYPYRERYITLHKDNINPKAKHNFKKYPADSKEVEYEYFDPSSLLMYGRTYFTKNGQPTFNYIRSEMSKLSGVTSYHNILFELTKNYKCQEDFCKGEDTDCGVGYLGYVNKKCICVCPYGFDAAERCTKTINSARPPVAWPETPFTMYKAKECPAGTEEGLVPLKGSKKPKMNLFKLPYSGKTLNIGICTKTTPTENVNYDLWPMGSYCIGKVTGVPCSEPFKEGEFTVSTKGTVELSGSVGDVAADGSKVTMKFCCQAEGDILLPMKLPNDKPFRLLAQEIRCQAVDGMWAYAGSVTVSAKAKKKGSAPRLVLSRKGFRQVSCYYQPATYGCSEDVTLSADKPSVTISVPMKGSSREPNRRCFYNIQAPKGDRMRITFDKMKIHPSDKFLVKHFNLLENGFKINTRDPPHQMITEMNELLIEYWSFYQAHWSLQGATFTVDLLPADKLCYDAAANGADYAGNKEISETYEECIPWEDATSCPDFPWTETNGLRLLNSGKSCRNLDSHSLLQPWCYTYVNGTMCNKRYCDVCNEADPIDLVHDCDKYIKDSTFCETNLGRFSCFKSCGMDTAQYDKDSVKCGKPVIPSGLTVSGDLQDSYDVGTSVAVSCSGIDTTIECTTTGWTPFDDQCSAKQCIDASQLCQDALSKFSEFCTNEQSKPSAEKHCKKSCGLCEAASCSISSGASYSLVSPNGGSVSTGQDVTFACNDGLHYKSGDLHRACSLSGDLLGEEPICEASEQPTDINLDQVTEKFKATSKYKAYLMLGEGLSIPYDGKITRWYFFCKKSKTITLLVYRKTSNSKKFKRVGSNTVKCVPMRAWSYDVPGSDQIAVKTGDVLGVHDSGAAVLMQPCGKAVEKLVPVAIVKARKVKSLLKKSTATFKGSTCAYLAIAAHLEPN